MVLGHATAETSEGLDGIAARWPAVDEPRNTDDRVSLLLGKRRRQSLDGLNVEVALSK